MDNEELVPDLAVIQDMTGAEHLFPQENVLLGSDITKELCIFLFNPDHKGYYVIAHNFGVSMMYGVWQISESFFLIFL